MLNEQELKEYIYENYVDVTDSFVDGDHMAGFCSKCKTTVGFQIVNRKVATCNVRPSLYSSSYDSDFKPPYSIYFKCPVCQKFKIWIVFERAVVRQEEQDDGSIKNYSKKHIFKVTALPNDGISEIEDLPDNPPSLKKAYTEAVKCLDNSCYLASATMFRRALQIITRDVLGATPSTLANELKEIVASGKSNKLGIEITNNFSSNSYIVRSCGNQSAHPDKDMDLLDFELEDAQNLYNIFLEIVSELFVAPKAAQKAKDELLQKRKLINK